LFQKINQTKPDQFSSRKKKCLFSRRDDANQIFSRGVYQLLCHFQRCKKTLQRAFSKKERIELSKKEEEKKRGFKKSVW
jgi:hypothetical protein